MSEQFDQQNIQALWLKQSEPERHRDLMREVLDVVSVKANGGQAFSALRLNRDQVDGRTPLVISGQFLASVCNPDRKWEGYQLAAHLPETPILLIDNPAHGRSDNFTVEQKLESLELKRFSKVGRAFLQVSRRVFSEAVTLDFEGCSAAGLGVMEMAWQAETQGFTPRKLVGLEPTGLERRSGISLSLGFFIREHLDQSRYAIDPAGAQLRASFKQFESELKNYGYQASDGISTFSPLQRDGAFLIPSFLFRNGLATTAGFDALEVTLESEPDFSADFMSGLLSHISRWKAIEPRVNQLQARFPDRLSWQVWPNDNHSVGLASQQPRLAAFAAAALSNVP
jgi:hypothetical protein